MDRKQYLAEYSKSSRAACKSCREKIDQGVLRIAHLVQSSHFDGVVSLIFVLTYSFYKYNLHS